jgi:hypothetical protein
VLDPAAKVAQEIQGCFVGPVNVFNNHNGERSHVAELLQQCAIQLISFSPQPGRAGGGRHPIRSRYRGETRARRA